MTSLFGKRLRAAREQAGLTQEQLAQQAGMAQSTLASAEIKGAGSRKTPQLAAACGVDAHWLATGEGQPYAEAGAASTAEHLSPWPLERLRESTWRALTERQKALLEDAMMTKLRELQAEASDSNLPTSSRRKPRVNGA